MGQQSSATVRHSEDGFTVDAEFIAGKLGLSPEIFWREVQRGIVYSVVERGEGEDAGRVRLTFRYRARSCSITLEDCGPPCNDKPSPRRNRRKLFAGLLHE